MPGSRRALTLLEVVVALGIAALALLSLVGVFTSALRLSAQGRAITVATNLSREFFERVRDHGYDSIPVGTVRFDGQPPELDFPPEPYPSLRVDGTDYRMVVSVAPRGDVLRAVTLRVSWGSDSHVEFQTYFRPEDEW